MADIQASVVPSPQPEEGQPAGRVSVFEAVNESLREFFIGTTASRERLPALGGTSASPCVAHWQPEHKVSCRLVETGMAIDEALKFVEHYAESTARTGWTVLTE